MSTREISAITQPDFTAGRLGRNERWIRLRTRLVRDKWLYLLLAPGVIYFLMFKYLPMVGLSMAFMDFQPTRGFLGSEWVGLKHFFRLFKDPDFFMVFRNTMLLSVYNLIFYFPFPIILALLMNEVPHTGYKRLVQTVIYVPHFISWPIIIGLVYVAFTTEGGIVNEFLVSLGLERINFLASERYFRPFVIAEIIFKEAGWGTIIYLAVLSGIDPQLYEAATIDGAGRFQKLVHVTLPHLKSAIVILFILRLGKFMESGFEQIFLMLNSLNRDVGEVFDTYVYTVGLTGGQYSYSAAVGMFKSLVSLALVILANRMAKRFGEEGVF